MYNTLYLFLVFRHCTRPNIEICFFVLLQIKAQNLQTRCTESSKKVLHSRIFQCTLFLLLFQNYTDFDECCKDKHIDCYYQENRRDRFQYSFFCGNSRECYFYNYKPALQLAKYNVENHYAVVGLAEDMELTIKIMEKYLPRYFKNASKC